MWRKLAWPLGLLGLLILLLFAGALIKLGPRFVFGILRYDTRREGELKVGDRAPDVRLRALDGTSEVALSSKIGRRPLVLIFGSFT